MPSIKFLATRWEYWRSVLTAAGTQFKTQVPKQRKCWQGVWAAFYSWGGLNQSHELQILLQHKEQLSNIVHILSLWNRKASIRHSYIIFKICSYTYSKINFNIITIIIYDCTNTRWCTTQRDHLMGCRFYDCSWMQHVVVRIFIWCWSLNAKNQNLSYYSNIMECCSLQSASRRLNYP